MANVNIIGTNNMTTMHLSYCDKSLPMIEKKIRVLSNFYEIFSVHLSMNEFYYASVISSKNLQIFSWSLNFTFTQSV